MFCKLFAAALVLAGLIAWETQPAVSAEFKLGSRFQDADGDMVADTPTDPSRWVDPATLIFAYTPVEDPAVCAKVWKGFLEHMEKVTGKKVQFFPVQSTRPKSKRCALAVSTSPVSIAVRTRLPLPAPVSNPLP